MYRIGKHNSFKRDYKRCKKRKYDLVLLHGIIIELAKNGTVPEKFKPHKLKGNYLNHWECHIKPDWLLIWKKDEINEVIILERTGTHSDLF